jgi:hypothetical protein
MKTLAGGALPPLPMPLAKSLGASPRNGPLSPIGSARKHPLDEPETPISTRARGINVGLGSKGGLEWGRGYEFDFYNHGAQNNVGEHYEPLKGDERLRQLAFLSSGSIRDVHRIVEPSANEMLIAKARRQLQMHSSSGFPESPKLQRHFNEFALSTASEALEAGGSIEIEISQYIQARFDQAYGPKWKCAATASLPPAHSTGTHCIERVGVCEVSAREQACSVVRVRGGCVVQVAGCMCASDVTRSSHSSFVSTD